MNPQEYERMHALESEYWWFVGRRAMIAGLLEDTLRQKVSLEESLHQNALLDIGCGTGANLPMLAQMIQKSGKNARVTALDSSPLALQFARAQLADLPVDLLMGDATRLPFEDARFDVVTMLDVLEHVEDDASAVREIYRVLKPGGAFVLSVPAYQQLWSAHDEALHHFRRYEYAGLKHVLKSGGFEISKLSFAMSLMPPVAWFWRRCVLPFRPRRQRTATRHSQGAVLPRVAPVGNAMLLKYLQVEGRMIRKRPLKFGTSLLAVARKKR